MPKILTIRQRYLQLSRKSAGFEQGKLRALAVDNLMRLMPRIEMRPARRGRIHDHVTRGLSVRASYWSNSIWSGSQIKVNGDVVVAVPAKDVILATGSRDRANLKAVERVGAGLCKRQRRFDGHALRLSQGQVREIRRRLRRVRVGIGAIWPFRTQSRLSNADTASWHIENMSRLIRLNLAGAMVWRIRR